MICEGYPLSVDCSLSLVAFAHAPTDVRSSCIAYIEAPPNESSHKTLVDQSREIGAPVVLVGNRSHLSWWKQGADTATQEESVPAAKVKAFFNKHLDELSPESVYRAKTLGKFETGYQLSFVDIGLMPAVERDIGKYVAGLLERVVSQSCKTLWPDPKRMRPQDGVWLMKSVFWLLAAKILKNKAVPGFKRIQLNQVEDVFRKIDKHYNSRAQSPSPIIVPSKKHLAALENAGSSIGQTGSLAHTSTESLAYVYKNTLIDKATRTKLGTHSTPPYLVDYIVEKLAPWLEKIPVENRHVFEPACGHAAFLVAAMRVLRSLLPTDQIPTRRDYLRRQLHGCDFDSFALEIARLSLTLADIPNPNGWDLKIGDMFKGDRLETNAVRAAMLLANPPFENFSKEDKAKYTSEAVQLAHHNKAAEMLSRTLPHLKPDSVFGVVLRQGFLHSKNATDTREFLCKEFQLQEICLFPDKMFVFSDAESAIILGRRLHTKEKIRDISYRRVRESDVECFKLDYAVTSKHNVPQNRFRTDNKWNLRLPEMNDLWEYCKGTDLNLESFADVGQGLTYHGSESLPKSKQTISTTPFRGAVRGFATFDHTLNINELPTEVWMSLDKKLIYRSRQGAITDSRKILLNYAPVSRGPWRLKALVDETGHAITSCFLAVRFRDTNIPLEYCWALLNSPLANGYAYTHCSKRHILAGQIKKLPVPYATNSQTQYIAQLARGYLDLLQQPGIQSPDRDKTTRSMLLRLDAEVLRLYELPPRLERELLDLFAGHQRAGVPFSFTRYYPEGYDPWFSLHDYLSQEYQSSTAGALRSRKSAPPPEVLLEALHYASEAFGSDE